MRRISILILGIILSSGCAGMQAKPEPWTGNNVDYPYIGISINKELVVEFVRKGSPAELAEIERGDIIVSLDGKIVTTRKECLSFFENMQRGDQVRLVINRNGQQINLEVEPRMIKIRPTGAKIGTLLNDDKRITLAVIVSEVKNSFPDVPRDWADSAKNEVQSAHESELLAGYGKDQNFAVVDRARLKQILDEFNFNQAGFVSDKLRTKIGEMTGANYILDISFSRFRAPHDRAHDVLNARLIEVESGKVLAVDQRTREHY